MLQESFGSKVPVQRRLHRGPFAATDTRKVASLSHRVALLTRTPVATASRLAYGSGDTQRVAQPVAADAPSSQKCRVLC